MDRDLLLEKISFIFLIVYIIWYGYTECWPVIKNIIKKGWPSIKKGRSWRELTPCWYCFLMWVAIGCYTYIMWIYYKFW